MKINTIKSNVPSWAKLVGLYSLTAATLATDLVEAAGPSYITTVKPIYTERFRNSYGGHNQMMSKMKLSFELMNTALRNSNADLEVLMVYPKQISLLYPSDTNGFDQFGGSWDKIRNQGAQGIWQEFINDGADYLHHFDAGYAGGRAFVGGQFAYTGSLGNLIFAHELGHNLGCSHADGNNAGPSIMSNPWVSPMYFSGPDVYYQGVALTPNNGGIGSKNIIKNNRYTAANRGKLNVDAGGPWNVWFLSPKSYEGYALDIDGGYHYGGRLVHKPMSYNEGGQHFRFNNFGGAASTFEQRHNGQMFFTSFVNGYNGTFATQEGWGVGKYRFYCEEQSDGYLRIRRDDGNKVVDVARQGVLQWDWHGGNHQRLKFIQKLD